MDFTHLWSSEGGAPGPDEWNSRTYDVSGSLLCDPAVATFNIIYSRTTSGNSNAVTVSTWIRRTVYPLQTHRIWTYTVSGAESSLFFNTDGTLEWQETSGSTTVSMKSSNVFYDNAGWYHIVVRLDTTQSTANDRLHMYVNGNEVTYATRNAMTQNSTPKLCTGGGELQWNSNNTGYFRLGVSHFAEGSHEPSVFAENDGLGQWRPKEPSLTWGSNDGYWKFMTASTMADDSSGNGNDLSLSGGNTGSSSPLTTYVQRFQYDSPTSVRGQKSYMEPYLTRVDQAGFRSYNGSGAQDHPRSTHGLQYGGAYRVEFQSDTVSSRNAEAGTTKARMHGNSGSGYWWRQAHGDAGETLIYRYEGGYYDNNGSYSTIATSQEANTLDSQSCLTGFRYFSWSSSGVATWTTDESLGATANINLYDTGSKRACQSHLNDGDLPIVTDPGYWDIAMLNHRWYSHPATTAYMSSNFGCGPFYRAESHFNYGPYTPPKSDGHVNESPVYDGKFYSNVLVGTGANIKGLAEAWLGADDGLVIIKDRDNSGGAQVIDTKRGLNNALSMTSTSGSSTYSAPSGNCIAVCWKEVEGYKNGFEIVRYTGNGAASRDITHNLGRRPCMIWIKAESTTSDWTAWYNYMSTDSSQKWTNSGDNSRVNSSNRTGGGFLATSGISNTNGIQFDSFRVGASSAALTDVNANGVNYVAYVWAPCEGYCSYDQRTFSTTYSTQGAFSWNSNSFGFNFGFKPRFVLHIGPGGSSTAGYCYVQDTQRSTPNVGNCSAPLIDLWGTGTEISATGWLWHSNGLYTKNPSTSGHYLSGNSTWTLGFAEVPLWGKSCSPASPFS